MTAIISKNQRKNEFIRILNSQREYFKHYFNKEEKLNFIFDRFVEIMYNFENHSKNYGKNELLIADKLRKQIRIERDEAYSSIILHKGSLL